MRVTILDFGFWILDWERDRCARTDIEGAID
jgi:hypothetical protein